MPTVPYTEVDALLQKHMEAQMDNTAAGEEQSQLEAEMKKRIDELLTGEREPWLREHAPNNTVAQADLLAEMKRLNAALSEGAAPPATPHPSKAADMAYEEGIAVGMARSMPTERPESATGGPQPITPETAPAGARILMRQSRWHRSQLSEAVVVEWSPSGQAVKLRWPKGAETWERDMLLDALLLEPLPPLQPPPWAKIVDALLRDKPGAAATMENLDERAARKIAAEQEADLRDGDEEEN